LQPIYDNEMNRHVLNPDLLFGRRIPAEQLTLYQYSTSGVFLQSGIPTGLPTYGITGGNDSGDFAETVAAPEPTTLPLFATGLGLLALLARRRRTNVGGQ
jgi:hypothetical protein